MTALEIAHQAEQDAKFRRAMDHVYLGKPLDIPEQRLCQCRACVK